MITIEGFQKTLQFIDMFIEGTVSTVILSALTVVFGFVLALLLAAMRLSNFKLFRFSQKTVDGFVCPTLLNKLNQFRPISFIASLYIEVFRATPMVVQLFIVYYVLLGDIALPAYRLFGFIRVERMIPGIIALSLNSAAYLSEIIRSGIQSIDLGQTEAARSLGLTQWQNMRYIILPQAIKNIFPAIANEFVTIIKESSICFTIGVQEIMSAVKSSQMAAFAIAEPLLLAAAIYFCLTFPTSKIIEYFERKMSRGDRR